jgi:2-methylcitrate dehydratase
MYIFAVALEDGSWHHEASYAAERARRPETRRLWQKIETVEDEAWTARYHDPDPARQAFGGRVEVELDDGETVEDELALAHAHPGGERAFGRDDYRAKFRALTDGVLAEAERDRFLAVVDDLPAAGPGDVGALTVTVEGLATPEGPGIF